MLNVRTETQKLESFVDCVDVYALDKALNKKQNHVYEVKKKLFSVFIIISYMRSIKNRRFLWIVKGYVEIILCEVPLYLLVCDSVCMKTHF